MENFADIYTDYLISSVSYTTATGLADLLSIKHDRITRCLCKGVYDSKFLWKTVKPYIQEITQSSEPVFLSFDDSIEAKPYSDESELICWHYDHSINRSVKGVNFLSALVQTGNMRLPCAVEFVRKHKWETDAKSGKQKRVSDKTKNELFGEMLLKCSEQFRFDYVLADSWYSSVKNMQLIRSLDAHFIMALKSNRKVAVSIEAKKRKEYISIASLQPGQSRKMRERSGSKSWIFRCCLQSKSSKTRMIQWVSCTWHAVTGAYRMTTNQHALQKTVGRGGVP